jgi:hypothetical protein
MKYYFWSGPSSETKDTTQVGIGALALETDTGNEYQWTGSEWNKTGTDGGSHAHIKDSDVPSDADRYLNTEGVTALAASTTSDTGDISAYRSGSLTLVTSAANVVSIFPSIDGTNFSTIPIRIYNEATNPKASVAASGLTGTLMLTMENLNYKNLRFSNGAGGTVTIVMGLKA